MLTRKIVTKLVALSIMLSSLGFVVTAGAEKAPPTECRACVKVPNKDIWFYCQWTQAHIACPAVPPPDAICIQAPPYCDPI
jgi:hypothetical protein